MTEGVFGRLGVGVIVWGLGDWSGPRETRPYGWVKDARLGGGLAPCRAASYAAAFAAGGA